MKICLETSDFYCWASSRSRIPCPCWWKVKLEKSYSSTNHHIFQFFCRGEFRQGRSVGRVLGKHYRMSCLDPGGKISYCNLYERHHKGCCTLPLPQVCHQCIQEWVKYTVWKRILNYFLKKIKLMKIFPLTPVSLETFCSEMIKKILPEHEFLPSQALFG